MSKTEAELKAELDVFIDRQITERPIEATVVRKLVRALKTAGDPVVEIFDTEEYNAVKTERDILVQVFNLDESYVITKSGGWVRLVMGQDYDMIADYTVSLEDALTDFNDWIMSKYY